MTELCAGVLLFLATQHIVIGLTPVAEFYAHVQGELVDVVESSELGIAEFDESVCDEELCSAVLTRLAGVEIGPVLCDVEAVSAQDCGPPWNEAWGFYHVVDDSMVGYLEFRAGEYWTSGGASFGWKTGEVYWRRLCNVDDWTGARIELGAPVGLCLRTLRGDVRCGP